MDTTLAERGIESVLLTSRLMQPREADALKRHLQEYQKQWPRRGFRRTGHYTRSTGEWIVHLTVVRQRSSARDIRVRLEVHPAEDGSLGDLEVREIEGQETKELQDVLRFIVNLNTEISCHVHVDWEFEPGSRDCVIKLPMLVTAGGKLPFTSISGVRFRKATEDDVGSIIVDSDSEGGMHVTAIFSLATAPSLDAVDRAISRGTALLEDLVVPVQASASEGKES